MKYIVVIETTANYSGKNTGDLATDLECIRFIEEAVVYDGIKPLLQDFLEIPTKDGNPATVTLDNSPGKPRVCYLCMRGKQKWAISEYYPGNCDWVSFKTHADAIAYAKQRYDIIIPVPDGF